MLPVRFSRQFQRDLRSCWNSTPPAGGQVGGVDTRLSFSASRPTTSALRDFRRAAATPRELQDQLPQPAPRLRHHGRAQAELLPGQRQARAAPARANGSRAKVRRKARTAPCKRRGEGLAEGRRNEAGKGRRGAVLRCPKARLRQGVAKGEGDRQNAAGNRFTARLPCGRKTTLALGWETMGLNSRREARRDTWLLLLTH